MPTRYEAGGRFLILRRFVQPSNVLSTHLKGSLPIAFLLRLLSWLSDVPSRRKTSASSPGSSSFRYLTHPWPARQRTIFLPKPASLLRANLVKNCERYDILLFSSSKIKVKSRPQQEGAEEIKKNIFLRAKGQDKEFSRRSVAQLCAAMLHDR